MLSYKRGQYAKQTRTCVVCGKEFMGRRDAQCCSNACLNKAWRAKEKEALARINRAVGVNIRLLEALGLIIAAGHGATLMATDNALAPRIIIAVRHPEKRGAIVTLVVQYSVEESHLHRFVPIGELWGDLHGDLWIRIEPFLRYIEAHRDEWLAAYNADPSISERTWRIAYGLN
jgi:predicted nucleic acid-binding Zn ribbon protein